MRGGTTVVYERSRADCIATFDARGCMRALTVWVECFLVRQIARFRVVSSTHIRIILAPATVGVVR